MMRWAYSSLLVTFSLLFLCPSTAKAQAFNAATIDEIVQDALKAWEVPGVAVAIVQGDRVIYLKGFGVRQLGGKEAVSPDTTFAISSCSKAFTTLAMAMLVDDEKMS